MKNFRSENEVLLIERFYKGDESAFSEIYFLHSTSLVGFASSKLYSLEEARDLVHDIFVYLWTHREKIKIHTSLQSYLFGMTRHRIIDHIRKNQTREKYAAMLKSLDLSLNESNHIDGYIEEKELIHLIDEIVDKLPPRTKEIYRLSRNEHKSIAEISEMLLISNQTVKNQLSSAIKFLKDSLSKYSTIILWYVLFDPSAFPFLHYLILID